ncbi:uncharacterized protein LOC130644690 [Hydractinia symbiolongicarpus]|uniref:uncharacterized protein LOC130644690 n=1 Tax=Hydractinia symbiolongicarpus TaxID=13093 RepID=UPI00254F962D|nr:uncharacterized protein LOC130644690 [Hydractinia symbiolongicarpus]
MFMMNIDHIHDMVDVDSDSEGEVVDDIAALIDHLQNHKPKTTVNSLRQSVINFIAKNINYWADCMPSDCGRYLYILSPFDCLRTADVLAITNQLVDFRLFQSQHIHLLFISGLKKIDFSMMINHSINDNVLRTLFNRCKEIKDLAISPKTKISLPLLNEVPIQYPSLEHLNVNRDVCPFEFISRIASHCKMLKSLHLHFCINIKNSILEEMKSCIHLQRLTLAHAEQLTCQTLQLILSSLNKLNYLSLVGCKVNFGTLNRKIEHPSIRVLNLSWTELSDQGLVSIVTCMKNIADLDVSNCKRLTTESFKYIGRLQSLLKLKCAYLSNSYVFDTNVEFCLIKIGLHLIELDLSGMPNVHTSTVAQCCPNLHELFLNHCLHPVIEWTPASIIFTSAGKTNYHWLSSYKEYFSMLEICHSLQKLSMSCMHVSSSNMPMLFSSENSLRKMRFLPWSLESTDPITERFFLDFITNFRFDFLEELNLSHSDAVSFKVVLAALKLYPKLKELSVVNCDLVEQEILLLKEIKKKSGINVVIQVSGANKNVVRVL